MSIYWLPVLWTISLVLDDSFFLAQGVTRLKCSPCWVLTWKIWGEFSFQTQSHHWQSSAPYGGGTGAPIPLLAVSSAPGAWLIPPHMALHLQASSWVGSFLSLNLALPLLPSAEKIICSSKVHVIRSDSTRYLSYFKVNLQCNIWMQSSKEPQADKKTFLSDQCKEIEESNRIGKTRDLFKKIRDTKGTFHAIWTQ